MEDNILNIPPDHVFYLPDGFIELTEQDEYLLYSDTDSAYLLYELPFNKYEDVHKLVDYIQGIASELRKDYNDGLNYYVGGYANMNPKYNTMDFKPEVIATKGFFNKKKFYGLANCWVEGTFYEEDPKIKKVGGQIKKSDVTDISKNMLNDIYHILVEDKEETDIYQMYKKRAYP